MNKYKELRKSIYDKNYENIINEINFIENHDTITSLIQQLENLNKLCYSCSLNEINDKDKGRVIIIKSPVRKPFVTEHQESDKIYFTFCKLPKYCIFTI